jgi:hypothetical protein
MTVDDKTGGQAFPSLILEKGTLELQTVDGMTLRDWFAGKALVGMIEPYNRQGLGREAIAAAVYSMADAILAERVKGHKSGE